MKDKIQKAVFISFIEVIVYFLIIEISFFLISFFVVIKNDLSFGIGIYYFYFIIAFAYLLGNSVLLIWNKKIINGLILIVILLLVLLYWKEAFNIYPYKTLYVCLLFIVIYLNGLYFIKKRCLSKIDNDSG